MKSIFHDIVLFNLAVHTNLRVPFHLLGFISSVKPLRASDTIVVAARWTSIHVFRYDNIKIEFRAVLFHCFSLDMHLRRTIKQRDKQQRQQQMHRMYILICKMYTTET